MPTVTVSARRFVLPPICVCCGAHPDRQLADYGDHGAQDRNRGEKRIVFPLCTGCLKHREHETSLLRPLQQAPLRGPSCEARGALVDFLSWKGTEIRIAFGSTSYAAAFVAANQAAGVRVVEYRQGGEPQPTSTFSTVALMVILATLCGVVGMCRDACDASRHDVQPATSAPSAPVPEAAAVPTAADAASPATHARRVHGARHRDGSAPVAARMKVCHDASGAAVEVPWEMPCREVGADEPGETASSPAPVAPPPRRVAPVPSSGPVYAPAPSGGPVQVQGYYRRDGTYVRGYSRRR